MDSLLGHRAARLFWVQYFGRHEATARWRELRDALCCEFGALSSGVLTELRSALDESKAGEVHLVDFALLTDSFGVAAAVVHAQRPSWEVLTAARPDPTYLGPAPSTAHEDALLKRTAAG